MEPMNEDLNMFFYKNRLATYSGWPFDEDCACTSENVSTVYLRGCGAESAHEDLA